jgi:ketosteroid isomerase-like protein
MSQENVEIVRRSIEAWNGRDLTTMAALWRSDGEVDWSRARGPLKGVYRGRGALGNFRDDFFATFEEVRLEAHDFVKAGSEVVVPNTATFEGATGSR